MRSRVLHCSRIASGNSLIHDRTGVRSDDVIPHPPQRTRPTKAGFAAFGRYAPACRRHGRGSPQLVVALGTRQRGSPDHHTPGWWKWKTLLAQNEAAGGSTPSPGTKTFFTYCAFSTNPLARKGKHGERPDVPDQMRVSTPHGAAALRSRYTAELPVCSSPMVMGSNPIPDLKRRDSSMVEHWTVHPEEGAGRSSQKMPAR